MLNAAVSRGGPTFASDSAEDDGSSLLSDWRRLLDVNLFGIVNGTQAFVPSRAYLGLDVTNRISSP